MTYGRINRRPLAVLATRESEELRRANAERMRGARTPWRRSWWRRLAKWAKSWRGPRDPRRPHVW